MILAVAANHPYTTVCAILGVSGELVRLWVRVFVLEGPEGLVARKSSGRPPKLRKAQKRELDELITAGPQAAGFPGGCWRSPMIQSLIEEGFGVLYSVHYIAQLLKNLGFSYQKAAFVADHKDAEKRSEWLSPRWFEIKQLAARKMAHILFGDEASIPRSGVR